MTLISSDSTARQATDVRARYVGEVVYIYAFDVAYEMVRRPVTELLGQRVAEFVVDSSKRAPRQLVYYRPQMVRLPPLECLGPRGQVAIERSVKLLPVGAISITVRVPFAVPTLADLVGYHDLRFSDGTYLYDQVRALAEEVRQELRPYYIRPVERLGEEEAYTVFCIDPQRSDLSETTDGIERHPISSDRPQARHWSTEDWVRQNRRGIAALLTEESDPGHLSDQEADESTGKSYSYYDRDAVVIDWDAAVMIDQPRNWDETLYLMELANLQLAELEAYDRMLDEAVERSYRDLSKRRFAFTTTSAVQRDLRELRIDLARLSDELSNISKFFGDWHLARIYQGLSGRFHLADWHRTIDEKLKTLDELYGLLRADQNTRWMFVLEVTIVFLFVIDLLWLVIGRR